VPRGFNGLVQQFKSRVDIVRLIGEYTLLHPSGPSRYLGLCPFHQETMASFNVHAVHQFYKCFSCGAGGDVIKL
jgi:DNA primase